MEDYTYLSNMDGHDDFPPARTAEYLLNQVMVSLFGCECSSNSQIETSAKPSLPLINSLITTLNLKIKPI